MKIATNKEYVSTTRQSVKCMFEVAVGPSTSSNSNSVEIMLISGGSINGYLPTNLFPSNDFSKLFSFSTPSGSNWFLCIDGTLDSYGGINQCSLSNKQTKPNAPGIVPNRPPSSFSFPIYAGRGSSFVRLVGCSPQLRSVIMFKEYESKNSLLSSDYTDHYTLSFS